MNTQSRMLTWILLNAVLTASILSWTVNSSHTAGVIASFLVWLSFAGTFISSLSQESRKFIYEAGRSVPPYAAYVVSIINVSLLLFSRHFVLAAAVLAECFLEINLFADF